MNSMFKNTGLKPIYAAFFMLVIVFACLNYFHEVIKAVIFTGLEDFGNNYFYSKAIGLGHNIYTMDTAAADQMRKSFGVTAFIPGAVTSPAYLLLIRPVTVLDFKSASKVWIILNNFLLFLSLFIILKLACENMPDAGKNFITASSLFMAFSFWPLVENLYNGNSNILVLFFIVLSLYLIKERRLVLAGVILSLSIIVKPNFGPLVLAFFLWKRCYRVFVSASISLVISELLPMLLCGKEVVLTYWTVGAKEAFLSQIYYVSGNLSLRGLANRMSGLGAHFPYVMSGITVALSSILLLYAIYATKKKFKDYDARFILEFSLLLTLACIISPVIHESHYILLYLPIILVWAKLSKDTKSAPLYMFILSFLLIALKYSVVQFSLFNSGFLGIFSGLKLYGVMILFFLTARMIKEESKIS